MNNYYKNNATSEIFEVDKVKKDTNIVGNYSIQLFNSKTHELEAECKSENIVLMKDFKDWGILGNIYENLRTKSLDSNSLDVNTAYTQTNDPDSKYYIQNPQFPFCMFLSGNNEDEKEDIYDIKNTIGVAHRNNISSSGATFGYFDAKDSYINQTEMNLNFMFPEAACNDKQINSIYMHSHNSDKPLVKLFHRIPSNSTFLNSSINGVSYQVSIVGKTFKFTGYNMFDEIVEPERTTGEIPSAYYTAVNYGFSIFKVSSGFILFGFDDRRAPIVTLFDSNLVYLSHFRSSIDIYFQYPTIGRSANFYFNNTNNEFSIVFAGTSDHSLIEVVGKITGQQITITSYQKILVGSCPAIRINKDNVMHYLDKAYDMKTHAFVADYIPKSGYATYSNVTSMYNLHDDSYFYLDYGKYILNITHAYIYKKIQPFSYTKLPQPILKTSEQYMKITYNVKTEFETFKELNKLGGI